MLTDILLGATLATILITASVLYAALNDIQLALTRIERRQLAICDELDVDLYEAQTVASPRQSTRV